ncbi:hypothetical protein CEQ51_07820 [Pseudomonas thivervalensis]|uniref:Uncharacterized protein n=1 Tax=Pseudomonas thivervalensis TaxID=86265 RepID=A0A2Z4Z8P3_9PSED|nr:hypothetical protein CE140_07980 [Pseudomonas thivervalensis]AXA59983.1 hypothetical protein CEQ51_07820 [Pseudomonas thivervalensis]
MLTDAAEFTMHAAQTGKGQIKYPPNPRYIFNNSLPIRIFNLRNAGCFCPLLALRLRMYFLAI